MRARPALTALAAAALLAVSACGGDETAATDPAAGGASAPAPAPQESSVPVPTVDVPAGEPPTELQITELAQGDGETAEAGDLVAVDYVGVLYSQPDQPFDESYSRGEPIEFQVGGGVIEGFSEGVTGMKVGGRRQVVIPPDKGYGSQGVGPIPPDSTLVFVMDLREVTKAGG